MIRPLLLRSIRREMPRNLPRRPRRRRKTLAAEERPHTKATDARAGEDAAHNQGTLRSPSYSARVCRDEVLEHVWKGKRKRTHREDKRSRTASRLQVNWVERLKDIDAWGRLLPWLEPRDCAVLQRTCRALNVHFRGCCIRSRPQIEGETVVNGPRLLAMTLDNLEGGANQAVAIGSQTPNLRGLTLMGSVKLEGDIDRNLQLTYTASSTRLLPSFTQVTRLQIENIHLGSNGGGVLEQLANMPRLTSLSLVNTRIANSGAQALGQYLQSGPSLKHLHLGKIIGVELAGIQDLAIGLRSVPRLEILTIDACVGGHGSAFAISTALETLVHLSKFRLKASTITDLMMRHLILEKRPRVEDFNMADNLLGGKGVGTVVDNMPNLKSLCLDRNAIGDVGCVYVSLNKIPRLQILSLEGTGITHQSAHFLRQQLVHTPSLVSINLSNNRLGSHGVRELAEGIRSLANITHISLNGTDMGNEGLVDLVSRLPGDVRTLDVGNNDIGAPGMVTAAASLPNGLSSLNLSGNNIEDGGVTAVAHILASLQSLSSLEMDAVTIDRLHVDAVRALSEGMQHVRCLTFLSLSDNRIGDDGIQSLAKCLAHLPNLKTLRIAGKVIDLRGLNALECATAVSCPGLKHVDIGRNLFKTVRPRLFSPGVDVKWSSEDRVLVQAR